MKPNTLVKYIPKKFGSPAWLPYSQAKALFDEDTKLISMLISCGAATEKDLPSIKFIAK